jgi:hypothetical protein
MWPTWILCKIWHKVLRKIWTNSNVSSNLAKEGLINNITTFEPTCNSKKSYLWNGPKIVVPKSLIAHHESLIITNTMQVS